MTMPSSSRYKLDTSSSETEMLELEAPLAIRARYVGGLVIKAEEE
jgi:hypothetical protein